jgi:predicted Zn-dependent protease
MDYARAAMIVEPLVAQHPNDYWLRSYLGDIYLRAGDLTKAEQAYRHSQALFPSEETRKILDAIRKARSASESSAAAIASPTPP